MDPTPSPRPELRLDGARLRQARLGKALTQHEVAVRAGLDTSTISLLERDRRGCSPKTVRALALALDVAIDDIATFVPAEAAT